MLRDLMETTKDKTPKVYPRGRVCARQGCGTILSQFNRWNRCALHAPRHEPIRFSEQHDALREMMALMGADDE